jgi:hypothetical protein
MKGMKDKVGWSAVHVNRYGQGQLPNRELPVAALFGFGLDIS